MTCRSHPPSYRCRVIDAGTVAALMLTAAVGCGRKPVTTSQSTASAHSAGISISVAPVIRKSIIKTEDVTGSLVALDDVTVGTKQAGKLAVVYVREGEPVTAGQVLAVMDTVDVQAQVQQARANQDMAVSKREQAQLAVKQAKDSLRVAATNLLYTEKTTATGLATAKGTLSTAQERLSVVRQGARAQERQQAQEQVRATKANADKARADLKRYQALYREQAISQSQLDQTQAAYDAAEATYNSAVQALSLIREGARPEEIRQAELAVTIAREGVARAEADREQVPIRIAEERSARSAVAAAESGLRAAEAGIVQAKAALRTATDNLANAYVRSPIQGNVARRIAEPGQQLSAGGAIMRVVSPKSIYFQAVLSESQYAEVHLDQPVEVRIDAIPGKRFRGRVTRVFPVASAARSFSIRVDFPVDRRMRPEMFARGSIEIATHENATLVPKDAILFDPMQDRSRVFVFTAKGTVEERLVRIGFTNPEYAEALSGARVGEKVVVAGQNTLQNGDRVSVQ